MEIRGNAWVAEASKDNVVCAAGEFQGIKKLLGWGGSGTSLCTPWLDRSHKDVRFAAVFEKGAAKCDANMAPTLHPSSRRPSDIVIKIGDEPVHRGCEFLAAPREEDTMGLDKSTISILEMGGKKSHNALAGWLKANRDTEAL